MSFTAKAAKSTKDKLVRYCTAKFAKAAKAEKLFEDLENEPKRLWYLPGSLGVRLNTNPPLRPLR
jgi:hypothetical protein